MARHTFNVQVIYYGTITVEARNLDDAICRVRGLAKPQGCFCDSLMSDTEKFETSMNPDVNFLSHSQLPNTED